MDTQILTTFSNEFPHKSEQNTCESAMLNKFRWLASENYIFGWTFYQTKRPPCDKNYKCEPNDSWVSGILSLMEVEALEKAISDDFIFRQGWKVNEKTGRILDQDGRSIYKAGYVNAIKKVLSETVKDDDNGV